MASLTSPKLYYIATIQRIFFAAVRNNPTFCIAFTSPWTMEIV
jgi:hypothetical protein